MAEEVRIVKDEVMEMLLEQMRELVGIDPRDEDLVRSAAVKTQTVTNCAKVANECKLAHVSLMKEKRETATFLAQARAAKMLTDGNA